MNMQTTSTAFYRTRDRFEIYSLLASNCVVDGHEVEEGGVVFFRFEDKVKCERLLTQLLSKQLKVYAHDMINAIRDAQTIFNHR